MKTVIVWILFFPGLPVWSQRIEPLIFREKTYDFGEIGEGKGNVDHEFVFTNNSSRPVKILSVQASCGCTTPGWSQNPIPQGKTGFVKASFDPRGRPGYFSKTLTISTDWDSNPIILQIKGQVVTGAVAEGNDFTVAIGNLHFKTRSFNFGTVYINKDATQKLFPILNGGTAPIKFISVSNPGYLKIEMPSVLAPQEKGVIKISYDGRTKNSFGFASDNIQITTNDIDQEIKSISIFAMLEEFYAAPSGDEAVKAPILFLREQSVDLGRSSKNTTINRSVAVRNSGKKDLSIKAVQGNCVCISGQIEKKIIRPGDSTILKISFRPQNREGTQQKAITLYSNDPRNPVQRINVLALIEN